MGRGCLSVIVAFVLIFALLGGLLVMAIDTDTSKVASPSPVKMKSKGISPVTGTFIQPWVYMNYTEERWEMEIAMWKEMGIEYIIMGDTLSCTCEPIHDPSKWTINASYPTQNPAYTKDRDVLTPLFEKLSENGIKIYVGIGNALSSTGWSYFDLNATGFENVCTLFADVAEEVYNIYYTAYPETFAGFYFVPEMYNSSNFDNPSTRALYVNNLSKGFKIVFDRLNELNDDLPFIFSPYVNMFGGNWVSKSTENIGNFWKELLADAGFRDGDILCPQDSVGAGGNDLENLAGVTAAYRYAVDNCGKDIQLWSNCEIFEQPKDKFYNQYDGYNYWSGCTVERMVRQMQIVSEYVDRIFLFAVPHYLSPYNTVDGYYDAYKYYLENGELETVPPTPPTKFRTSYQNSGGKKTLTVYWSGMYDNIGVHRVNIYKDGEFFTYRNSTRNEGTATGDAYPNNFIDLDYDPEKEVTYEFEVIDCTGNISEKAAFTVEPGSVPNKVRLDNPYTGPVEESSVEESSVEESRETTEEVSEETSEETSRENNNKKGKSLIKWIIPLCVGAAAVTVAAAFILINQKRKNREN